MKIGYARVSTDAYSSYQADLIVRLPKRELQAVLIKQQHNASSSGTDYPLRLPRMSMCSSGSGGARLRWRGQGGDFRSCLGKVPG
jgi:hypothetical protein